MASSPVAGTRPRRLDVGSVLVAPVGLAFVGLALWLEGSSPGSILQLQAALIVVGGTVGAVLVSFAPGEVVQAVRAAADTFYLASDDLEPLATSLVSLSLRSHRHGVIALEADAEDVREPFLREALRMVADGTDTGTLRDYCRAEQATREEREDLPARIFEAAAGYAPTLGILGAVIGLIHVMENLASPGALGPGIAVAFVATVYGVGGANLVLLPLAGRLRQAAARTQTRYDLMTQGIFGIHQRTNPRLLAQQLRAFALDMPRFEVVAARTSMRAPRSPRIPA